MNKAGILDLNLRMIACFTYMFLFFYYTSKGQSKIINDGWLFSKSVVSENWEAINLPHTFNLKDAFDDDPGYYRGKGYYKKKIFIHKTKEKPIYYLRFNAVNQTAKVKVNGKFAGEHIGGYTAFTIDISKLINFDNYNLIEVEVDNSHNVDIPPLDADFTFYGGIYRDVELINLPAQHFSLNDFSSEGYYISYTDVSESSAGLHIKGLIDNFEAKSKNVSIHTRLYDASHNILLEHLESYELTPNTGLDFKIELPHLKSPKLWSPDEPNLYDLKLQLKDDSGEIIDSKATKVGFRWFSVNPEAGFTLNGKPIKLIGVNRHQDYAGYGNAVPNHLQEKDIHLIKDMGANVIRFAHYPHSRDLYKLCDELGILVWTEIPVINKVTGSKAFFNTSLKMQEEHVKQYFNHPSVVMYGYMNEIFLRLAFDNKSTDEEKEQLKKDSYDLAKQLEQLTRKLAPDRLTVMALHFNELYNETGIADLPMVLGWNLYFGWYHDEIKDLGLFLDDQNMRYPERSLFLSEYGPGADIRLFTSDPRIYDYSTDYQYLLHKGYLDQVMERDFVVGMTAWNFADFGSEFRADAIPHVNQKGIMTYNRTPKDVYYFYKASLNDEQDFVFAAVDNLEGTHFVNTAEFPIQIFSNAANWTVRVNGEQLQTPSMDLNSSILNIPIKDGLNEILFKGDDITKYFSFDATVSDKLDFKNFEEIGINIGSHLYFKNQDNGLVYIPDQKYDGNTYGYLDGDVFNLSPYKHQGIPYNIRNTEADPLYQSMLMDCKTYKMDIPKGEYKLVLSFVEPQLKAEENIYSLNKSVQNNKSVQSRSFDIYANGTLLHKSLNLAAEYPEKYAVDLSFIIDIENDSGLELEFKPIEGEPVLSGLLLKKLD